jgi:N-acetylglucosamine kinase-like BadF-type ATPase
VIGTALAVDAGQTEIRAALVDGERGPRIATAPGVLQMGGSVGPEEVAAGLMAAVSGLGPLPEPPLATGVGLSGLESVTDGDLDRLAELLRRDPRVGHLAIASDALTALLGALGTRDGVVVAAGTGTACLGRRGERLAKVDGWGALLGDAGSGFAIGRAGLDAALREFDGRGGSGSLMGAAKRHFGTIEQLPARVNAADVPTRAIAGFAVDVAREAAAGDKRAVAILRDAGVELATAACAALRRLYEPDQPAVVSYTGNVFRAGDLLVDPFTREVTALRPNTRVVPPAGDPLAGARLLVQGGLNLRPEPGILSTWA